MMSRGMIELIAGVVMLIALVVIVLWLISLPSADDEEELAGLLAGNWEHVEDTLDPRDSQRELDSDQRRMTDEPGGTRH
jgi:hypothetical protein